MHSGLLRSDNVDAHGMAEARQVAEELRDAPDVSQGCSQVALIFDYDADFAWATQPHGQGPSYFARVFDTYRAMRSLGLSIDILPSDTRDFSDYRIAATPGLIHFTETLPAALAASDTQMILGPRSGARTDEMGIPTPLPPSFPGLDVTVSRVESLRPDMPVPLAGGGHMIHYREVLDGDCQIIEQTTDGSAVGVMNGSLTYLGGWLDQQALRRLFSRACEAVKFDTIELPDGVRSRNIGSERFWFNYNSWPVVVYAVRLAQADVHRQQLAK